MSGQRRMLTETDQEKISRGIAENLEGKVIAARIGRCPSVVSREIARHGGRARYRAVAARRVAAERRRRPKPRKLDTDHWYSTMEDKQAAVITAAQACIQVNILGAARGRPSP